MLDGVEITSEEKVKAENLHGLDQQDREIIFTSLLPEEKFIDRRISQIEEVPQEIDSDGDFVSGQLHGEAAARDPATEPGTEHGSFTSSRAAKTMARVYVGELI